MHSKKRLEYTSMTRQELAVLLKYNRMPNTMLVINLAQKMREQGLCEYVSVGNYAGGYWRLTDAGRDFVEEWNKCG